MRGCLLTVCIVQPAFAKNSVDFNDIQWFAIRAKAAYSSPAEIKQQFPNTVRVATVADTHVQYFLERDDAHKHQVITVRGTANLANIREDAECLPSKNTKLNIVVHSGFDEDAHRVYQDIKPHLKSDYKTVVTGHSLGAAISTLLMMYLHEDSYRLLPSANFGQPKVTNELGAKAYDFLPLTRIVDNQDPVPELPPRTLMDAVHGAYQHLGDEVILLPQQFYVYLNEHAVAQQSADTFWNNLGEQRVSDHYMANYLKNIAPKLEKAEAVEFKHRQSYLSP